MFRETSSSSSGGKEMQRNQRNIDCGGLVDCYKHSAASKLSVTAACSHDVMFVTNAPSRTMLQTVLQDWGGRRPPAAAEGDEKKVKIKLHTRCKEEKREERGE